MKLARCYRSGDLTAVWVPDEGSEALRDLVRAREAAKQDQLRARHRLSKFLLRIGPASGAGDEGMDAAYLAWVRQIHFAQPAQEATLAGLSARGRAHGRAGAAAGTGHRGSGQAGSAGDAGSGARVCRLCAASREISAVTIVCGVGRMISRFEGARQLMGYSGAVPSEDSSGKRTRRGSITKTGNAHLRRIVVEAAWSYRLRPGIGPGLRKRQEGVPEEIKEIAWKAQHPAAQALPEAGGGGQRPTKDHHRRRPRTAGLHLGHRDQGRKRQPSSKWRPDEKQQQRQKQKLSKE